MATSALSNAVLVSKTTFDTAPINIADYATLRNYNGGHTTILVTAANVGGIFAVDATDVASADNGTNIIVDKTGRRWKRQISGHSVLTNLSFDTDNKTVSPTQKNMVITGVNGPHTGGILGITGVRDNQELILLGATAFPVTLTNTNVKFAGNATNVTFGNTTDNVQAMMLLFRDSDKTWYEISRTTY